MRQDRVLGEELLGLEQVAVAIGTATGTGQGQEEGRGDGAM